MSPYQQMRREVARGMGQVTAGEVTAGVQLLTALVQPIVGLIKGCGATCTEATSIVEQAETVLQQNLQTYIEQPVHYQSLQAQAAANFNTIWNGVVAACRALGTGTSAGANCVADRQAGACYFHATPGKGWYQVSTDPGTSNLNNGTWAWGGPAPVAGNPSGSICWDWFMAYYDPIINDPSVVPDTAASAATGAASSVSSALSSLGIPSSLIVPGAIALVLGLVLFSGNGKK